VIRYKFIIGVLLVLCLQPLHAFAQGSEPSIPTAPTGGNVVLDTLDWLTPAQESEINSINQTLDKKGIAQIAVVTLNDCGNDKQKFRNDLFRTWGIGHADDNDGLLILVCWYGGDQARRSVEQETGYGLEGTLPDVLTARIATDNFVPAFKANRPGEGLVAMVRQYDGILRQVSQTDQQLTQAIYPTQAASSVRSTQVPQPVQSTQSTINEDVVNTKLAYLIIGFLGSLPGLALSIIYATKWETRLKSKTGRKPRAKRKLKIKKRTSAREDDLGFIFPKGRQVVLAEIIFLIPVLVILYIGTNMPSLPQSIQAYSYFIGRYLFLWLIILIVGYLLSFVPNLGINSGGDNWGSGSGSWGSGNGSGGTGGDSFGGGSSGGGGSSSKF